MGRLSSMHGKTWTLYILLEEYCEYRKVLLSGPRIIQDYNIILDLQVSFVDTNRIELKSFMISIVRIV
jgi:hypothetical protein